MCKERKALHRLRGAIHFNNVASILQHRKLLYLGKSKQKFSRDNEEYIVNVLTEQSVCPSVKTTQNKNWKIS